MGGGRKVLSHISAGQGSVILSHGHRSIVQRRQSISLDIPNGGGGIAQAVPDVLHMLSVQFQEAAADHRRGKVLPADADGFS